jgi:hypothetical protein
MPKSTSSLLPRLLQSRSPSKGLVAPIPDGFSPRLTSSRPMLFWQRVQSARFWFARYCHDVTRQDKTFQSWCSHHVLFDRMPRVVLGYITSPQQRTVTSSTFASKSTVRLLACNGSTHPLSCALLTEDLSWSINGIAVEGTCYQTCHSCLTLLVTYQISNHILSSMS